MLNVTAADILSAREALFRPTAQAQGLPGRFYGPAFFEIEQEKLFPHAWCAVTVAAAIPEPGDILPIDLAGWQILVLRDRDGEIRAFHNVCRHRGIPLMQAPCSKARMIRCPWHAWSYDLKGALLATPEVGGPGVHESEGFDRTQLGLKPIAIGRWLDYIFVNIDGQAGPFEDYIRPVEELYADFDFDNLVHGGRVDSVYQGNWKLSVEGGIEDYHLPVVHPQLRSDLTRNTEHCAHEGVYVGGWIDVSGDPDEPAPPPTPGTLPPLTNRAGEPITKMMVLSIFPTAMLLLSPDSLKLGMLMPDGPSKTKVELHLYYKGDAAKDPQFQAQRDSKVQRWQEVLPQDNPFIEGAQRNLVTRDLAGIRTKFSGYWEQTVQSFQKMVLDAVS